MSHYGTERLSSKGKEICQDGRDDQVTKTSTKDIQKMEHFGVQLEDTTDSCQEHHISTQCEQGTTSRNIKGTKEIKDNKDDFSVIV